MVSYSFSIKLLKDEKKKLLGQDSDQTVRWHESYCYLLVSPELKNSLSVQKIFLIKICWFQAGTIGLEVKIQKADFTGEVTAHPVA